MKEFYACHKNIRPLKIKYNNESFLKNKSYILNVFCTLQIYYLLGNNFLYFLWKIIIFLISIPIIIICTTYINCQLSLNRFIENY